MYAELNCHSNFSFLAGGSHPEALAERAAALGLDALALTDDTGFYGAVRFYQAARSLGLKAIFGAEIGFENGGRAVVLVRDAGGYARLSTLLTKGLMGSPRGEPVIRDEDLWSHAEGLILLAGQTSPPQLQLTAGRQAAATQWLDRAREAFGRRHVFIEASRHFHANDDIRWRRLQAFAANIGIPGVATNAVRYATAGDRFVYDVLTCVREHTTLAQAGLHLEANAERRLKSAAEMNAVFPDAPDWVRRSVDIAQQCTFDFSELRYKLPAFETGGEAPHAMLSRLAYEGAAVRYGSLLSERVAAQLRHELDVIARLDFAGYFLIVWDVVRFCQEKKILSQGRGSAANSAVCYCLGITAVDPSGLELLFERFLSAGRAEPPDIDLDIAHQHREEVIQYVYTKYGRERAGMVCEVITYQARSAVRDVGKALGLSLDQVDRIAKRWGSFSSLEKQGFDGSLPPPSPALPPTLPPKSTEGGLRGKAAQSVETAEREKARAAILAEWGVDPTSPDIARLVNLVQRIQGYPRHLSIHVGGMVVAAEPLSRMVPVEPAAMAGRSVIQWDKDDAAAAGLVKIDLLGLGMLTLLQEGFKWIEKIHGRRYALHELDYKDSHVFDLLCRADTVGVFQVESRAQMNCLPRLKPRCFYDLVVEVALIRPGPIQGEMVHPYLRRREGTEPITYAHPDLIPILKRTLGIPLFQEQGMRLAVIAAGFTPAEADELRRAMGHKRSRVRMQTLLHKLLKGMERNGYGADIAERIVKQLTAFADYGFPESHAAGFALLVYASAWMKHYYPVEFYTALLNAQPMGFYSPSTIVNDAKRHGVAVFPADVQRSTFDTQPEGPASDLGLRLGLRMVKGFGEAHREAVDCLLQKRPFETADAAFNALDELPVNLRRNLAAAGALDNVGVDRRQARWALEKHVRPPAGPLAVPAPEYTIEFEPLSQVEEMQADYALTGLSVRHQPLAHYRKWLQERGSRTAAGLLTAPDTSIVRIGGLVICRQRPGTAKGMLFITLEDESGLANVVVFPQFLEKERTLWTRTPLIFVTGKLERVHNVTNVIAREVIALPPLPRQGQMDLPSRDFR